MNQDAKTSRNQWYYPQESSLTSLFFWKTLWNVWCLREKISWWSMSVNDISFLASQQIFQHLPKEDLTCHQTCTNGFMNNISIINSTIMWKPLVKHSWIYQSFRMTAINLSNLKLDLWGLIIGCQQKRLRMRYHFHPFILKIFYHSLHVENLSKGDIRDASLKIYEISLQIKSYFEVTSDILFEFISGKLWNPWYHSFSFSFHLHHSLGLETVYHS